MKNENLVNKKENANNEQYRYSLIRSKIIKSFNISEEMFLKKNYCDRETLFQVCLPYFQSSTRQNEEKIFISLYLYYMKKFIILLKSPSLEKFNQSLNYVAENLIYQNFGTNNLIMRYGDKADYFYIILSGLVSILIPIKVNMSLNKNEYNRYIALLILYEEFELVKLSLRDNKSEYLPDIPDLQFIVDYFNKNKEKETKHKKRKFKLKNQFNKYRRYSLDNSSNLEDEEKTGEEIMEKYYINSFESFMFNNLTNQEFVKFKKMKNNINFESESDEIVEPKKYIERIQKFKLEDLTDINLIKRFHRLEKTKNEKYKKKRPIVVYKYIEIDQFKTGDTFGEVSMQGNSAKRTATIINLTESHFGCLNKEVFSIVKENSEKKRKEKINFLCHIKLFKSIGIKIMSEKYINLFAFKEAVLDEYIIKRGEINNHIIIIKSGIFEVNFTGSINEVFNLINFYIENHKENNSKNMYKIYKLDNYLIKRIKKLNENKKKIINIFEGDEIKNGHKNHLHKLFVLNNLAIFGLKETEKKINNNELEEFESVLDIKCTSIEGEYALLDKKIFEKQIYSSDHKVKEETKSFVKDFIENTLNRLVSLLYCKIWNILTKNEMQVYKYIRRSNIQENEKEESDNIINDIGLDVEYMENNNLNKIECIVDTIFNKYSDNAFDYKHENLNLFDYSDKEVHITLKNNEIKFEEKKYDKNKYISIMHGLSKNRKKFVNKIGNFKSVINKGKAKLLKNMKIYKPINVNKEHSIKINHNNNSKQTINNNNSAIIDKMSVDAEKESRIYFIRKNILTPKTITIKLRRSVSSYGEKNIRERTLDLIKSKRAELIKENSSGTITRNSSAIKANLCKSMKLSSDIKYGTVDSLYSNYGKACNAHFSRINLSLIKYETTGDQNFIFSNKTNFKRRCNYSPSIKGRIQRSGMWSSSMKYSNYSFGSFFDSTQISKDSYAEKRKLYILKNTRNYFTRNKNLVLSKSVKKKEDKNI